MPDLPSWYRRINEIQNCLEASDAQMYARGAIEDLFRIKKTAAVQLMRRIGGLGQVGTSQTVSRRHVLLFLYQVQSTPGYVNEVLRIESLDRKLEAERRDLQARRRTIPVERAPEVTIDGLPGVSINYGRLTVEFCGTEDLLRKLYELGQAIVQDWNRFERVTGEN